nr:immunoglobulin light chain junction region [Macaca mulatta]MOW11752.1 immunoglobulin light chain junction region [Macaca mulatta]
CMQGLDFPLYSF